MVAKVQTAEAPAPAERRVLRGVIFDMDGTLTVPNHDFAEMYRRVGCKTRDILTEIESWPEDERKRANDIIHEMETEALATMKAMPGAEKLGAFLDGKGLPRGLVTRNVQASVAHFHANAWTLPPFSPALAREFKPYSVLYVEPNFKDQIWSEKMLKKQRFSWELCMNASEATQRKQQLDRRAIDGGAAGSQRGYDVVLVSSACPP